MADVHQDDSIDRSRQKTAGATLYLIEELGDARLNCDHLIRYLTEAVKLIEKSSHKDHFFEVAGHLIRAVPQTAFKLQKSLQAVALAAGRIDYEELKQELRPEKVDELERVLKEVRIRPVQHRSENPMLTPKYAADRLRDIARQTRAEGYAPTRDIAAFVQELDPNRQASGALPVADALDKLAGAMESQGHVSRGQLATLLSRIAMEQEFEQTFKLASRDKQAMTDDSGLEPDFESIRTNAIAASRAASTGRWRPALLSLYYIVDDIGTVLVKLGSMDTQKSEQLKREIRQMLPQAAKTVEEMSHNSVMATADQWRVEADSDIRIPALFVRHQKNISDQLDELNHSLSTWAKDKQKYHPQLQNALDASKAIQDSSERMVRELNKIESEVSKTASDADDKLSRYEEGKPADPTENMNQEDAEEWKENTEEHKDKFKTAGIDSAKLLKVSPSSTYGSRVPNQGMPTTASDVRYRTDADAKLWIARGSGDIIDAVHIQEIPGPGIPLYVLILILKKGDKLKYRKEFKKLSEAKTTGLQYLKSDDEKASLILTDFRKLARQAQGPDSHYSRYEEGKPADPTENMNQEDAEEWKENTEEHKDKFKTAGALV